MGSSEPAADQLALEVELGKTYRLDRLFAIHTSRETDQPIEAAREHAERAIEADVAAIIGKHREAWLARWSACEIRIDGDPAAQLALRWAMYHLLSAANPEDERVSIRARALTGSAYRGHVFWDTEIFMLPFFALTYPPAARALLMYRYHARRSAGQGRRLGYHGALYAWESADTGEEVTPPFVLAPDGEVVPVFAGQQEHHISADVAYGVWSYWRATGDERFLVDAGAEILLETARFWASRATGEEDGHYHIRGVIGPDEYHTAVDDNAYTNEMARWNLEIGEVTARLVAERWPERWRALSRRLSLSSDERYRWETVAQISIQDSMNERDYSSSSRATSVWRKSTSRLRATGAPMDVLLGRQRIERSKVIKQPDVVMLLHLLWDRFPPEVREANFRYYEPRCAMAVRSARRSTPSWRRAWEMSHSRSATSGRRWRSIWPTTWVMQPVAFTLRPLGAFGRPPCSALLVSPSQMKGLSLTRTCHRIGAASRCSTSGEVSGMSSRFRLKFADRSSSLRGRAGERADHPRPPRWLGARPWGASGGEVFAEIEGDAAAHPCG